MTATVVGNPEGEAEIYGRVMRTKGNFSVSNCYSTKLNGKMFSNVFDTQTVNGVTKWFAEPYDDGSVAYITEDRLSQIVKYDANGFISSVSDHLMAGYVQDNVADNATLTASDTYAIRFVALCQLENATSAGMTIVVKDPTTGAVIKTFDTSACEFYDTLTAFDADGAQIAEYSASDYGASKFAAVIIKGIPAGAAYDFEITTHYTTEAGIVVNGNTKTAKYDANGRLLNGAA
ncbi:MAG: hypothetical protein IJ011_01890 [Clostridia bacterium]|nr:hypothetical protein [Clostridia bacterium]